MNNNIYEVFKLEKDDLEDLYRYPSFDGDLDDDDAFESFKEWNSESSYICDAIMEIADGQVAIYDCDLWRHAQAIEDYIEEAINEGLVDLHNFSLTNLFQNGEYQYYTSCLYKNLDELCTNWILRKCSEVDIAWYYKGDEKFTFDDLKELILEKIDNNVDQMNVDNNNRFSDLISQRDIMIEEILSELTNENLLICKADDFEDLYADWLDEYAEEV